MEENDNIKIHKGHRARMKSSVRENGIETLNDHQVLEVLLFYAIANGDTNPVAHRLVNEFGSLKGVLEAERNALLSINGIGENAADLISFVRMISKRYLLQDVEQRMTNTANTDLLRAYFERIFLGIAHEEMHVLLIDENAQIICEKTVTDRYFEKVAVNPRVIAELAIKNDCGRVVLAHNHPRQNCIPSPSDLKNTLYIKKILESIEIELVDHIIVGCGGSLSMCAAGYFDEKKKDEE